jgi:ABC-type branched-subunit amino acid transport system substrate-binding protein
VKKSNYLGKGLVVAMALTLVSAALAGFSSSSGHQAATTARGSHAKAARFKSGNYSLGEIDDLTGGFSFVDVPWHQGIVAAINAANAAGGVNHHKVVLYSRDSQGSGTVGATAFKQLTSQFHVSAILGVGDSLVDAAIFPLANAAHVPVTPIGPPGSELQKGSYFYEYGPSDLGIAKAMVAYAASLVKSGKLSSAKIATLGYDDPNSTAWAASVKQVAQAAGLTVAANIPVDPTATDYSTYAASFASSGANILFTEVAGASATTLIQALTLAGVPQTTAIVGFPWSVAPSLPWKNYHVISDYRELGSSPGVKAFQKAMKLAKLSIRVPLSNESYADAELVMAALGRCGFPCNPRHLNVQLQKTHTTLGGLAFGPVVWSSSYRGGPTALSVAVYSNKGEVLSYGPATVVEKP